MFGGDLSQDKLLGLMALGDAFSSLGQMGGGPAAQPRALPLAFQMQARQQAKEEAAERERRASEAFLGALSFPMAPQAATPQAMPAPSAPQPAGFNFDMVRDALVKQESGGDPTAVSPKGAGGIAQIMPATARDPGYGVPSIYALSAQMGGSPPPLPEAGDRAMTEWLADPRNAAVNEEFGRRYFNAMSAKYGGDPAKTLAAYNAGPGAVDQYGGVPPYQETQDYVAAIAPSAPPQPPSQPVQRSASRFPPEIVTMARAMVSGGDTAGAKKLLRDYTLQAATKSNAGPRIIEGADGYKYTEVAPNQWERTLPGVQAAPNRGGASWVRMSASEIEEMGGDPNKAYLRDQNSGNIKAVGGGGQTINVDTGEDKWVNTVAKEQATMFSGLSQQGIEAQGELALVGEMEELLAQGDLGGTADAWKQWAQDTLSINIGAGGASEAFSALINRLTPSQRPPGSGQMSDRDVEMFRRSLPQMVNTSEGNALILDTMRGMAEFKRAQGEISNAALVGRITREEAMERLYALPDPLAKFRAMRAGNDDRRKRLDELRGGD